METEKSSSQIDAEKIAFDQAGHSETQTDIHLNKAVSDPLTKPVLPSGNVFLLKKKKSNEKVLLEVKKK